MALTPRLFAAPVPPTTYIDMGTGNVHPIPGVVAPVPTPPESLDVTPTPAPVLRAAPPVTAPSEEARRWAAQGWTEREDQQRRARVRNDARTQRYLDGQHERRIRERIARTGMPPGTYTGDIEEFRETITYGNRNPAWLKTMVRDLEDVHSFEDTMNILEKVLTYGKMIHDVRSRAIAREKGTSCPNP